MIEHIRKNSKKNHQTLNIAGHEISAVLDINEPSAMAHEKFELLRKYCLETLGIDQHSVYREVMNHYLRNGGCYFLGYTTENSTEKQLTESKKDYTLFRSAIERIGRLDEQQKKSFLQDMKHHHDTDKSEITENPIIVMDRVLSSILKPLK